MCASKSKLHRGGVDITPPVAQINGRPVLQPTCNRVPSLERRPSLKKAAPKSPTPPPPAPLMTPASVTNTTRTKVSLTPPISPKSKSPRPPAVKRGGNELNGLNSSTEKMVMTPTRSAAKKTSSSVKKSRSSSCGVGQSMDYSALSYESSLIVEAPGSIAATRREQVATMQEQRKMKIAHYGRTKSGKYDGKVVPLDSSATSPTAAKEEKRCSFITPNSDPVYVAYHDEEWGVPVHDDKMLFELLVLTGAQVGSDWTSVLKKRQGFREAFSGFDAEIVAKFSEKKITSISADYGMELSQVRGVVDNAKRILEIEKVLGSFDKYLWGFIQYKPVTSNYKLCQKIPVKTSKSETISKDMVRRGFRLVGPTVVHSFMEAAGLSNDHLVTCPRHLQCIELASHRPTVSPAAL